MVKFDLKKYADINWADYIDVFTNLSKNDKGNSLLESNCSGFNFDEIVADKINWNHYQFSSVDAICFSEKSILLIEFKSGLKDIMHTKEYYLEENCVNDQTKKCNEYGKTLYDREKFFRDSIYRGLRIKGLESKLLLEKYIFPLCEVADREYSIKYVVVVDATSIDKEQEILLELSGENNDSNVISAVYKALQRYKAKKDMTEFCFDDVKVVSKNDVEKISTVEELERLLY